MERSSTECVDLAEACVVLSKIREVQALIKRAVGTERLEEALSHMQAGSLDGEVGAIVHDLLLDAIVNDAHQVWSGFIKGFDDDYPVNVNEYHGIYWVWAMEYEPAGYFIDKEEAIAYARSNWDDIYEA